MSKATMDFRFNADGKFKIMAIGDIHERCGFDAKTADYLRLLDEAAQQLKPDIAIFMGDILLGAITNESPQATAQAMYNGIKQLSEPLTRRGIPFAIVFGNHDGQSKEVTKEMLFEQFKRMPGFVNTDNAGVTGCGNCYALIYDHEGKKPLFNLWLIDSGSDSQDGSGGYAWVDDSQIAWYEGVSNELKAANGGEPLPSMVFQHIPVCEEYLLLKETTILNPYRVKGQGALSDRYYVKADNCTGYLGEGPCVPSKNNGQFKSWVKQGDVIAAFFGHDHLNDFIGEVEGITLAQTKCAGFHIYGDGLHQGVCMITLNESSPRCFETKMHYYRDFFGTKCNTIKGYDLLTDRWHTNFKVTLAVLGAGAALSAVSFGLSKLLKKKK